MGNPITPRAPCVFMNDVSDGGSARGTRRAAFPSAKSRLLYSWYMVGVFCLAALVSYTDRLVLSALVDPIKRTLEVDDSSISLLQGAAFALVYVFSGLLLGRLADKRRRLTILIIGSSVWCGGTISCGLAPSFWALFAARVVVGVGEAALAPAAVSIISDSFSPSRRGAALGVFMLGSPWAVPPLQSGVSCWHRPTPGPLPGSRY